MLGLFYNEGLGIAKDTIRAFMWFSVAFSNGYLEADYTLEFLRQVVMTPADVSKAQQLAKECIAKNYKDC